MKHILFLSAVVVLLVTHKSTYAQDPNFHIYLCFGQSNMAGAGDIETQDQTVDSRFQFMKPQDCAAQKQYAGNWYPAIPPLWGCSGGIGPADYFGRTMVANLPSTIKVGVVNVAVPGCDIALFGKTGFAGFDTYNYVPAKYNGSAYAWLLDLAKQAQKVGVIKGILLHQGETNTGQSTWPAKVKAVYDNLIADLGLNATQTPLLVGELLYQNQGGVCWSHNSVIATVPNVIPNSYVISANGLPGKDTYHFNSAGNRSYGVRYAEKMLSLQPVGLTVAITSPASYSVYSAPATITFSASASDPKVSVAKVEFYNGTTKLGEDLSAPYTFEWANIGIGTYYITAVATNASGVKATSARDTVKVNPAQAAYGGTPWPVPGKVEFENYDAGGNGFAYSDGSAGSATAVAFRTDEDVDIENCTDVGAGYNIGYSTKGEWLEYTVDVAKAGTYDLTLRVACNGDGRTLSVSAKDVVVAKDVAIPNTAGWQAWTDVVVKDIALDAGVQVIRVTIGALDYVNLNYMSFSAQAQTAPSISLKAGWNLIGYPIEGSSDVETALAGIWENVETVKNASSFYDTSLSKVFNTLTYMNWGEGYVVKVSKDCDLIWNTQK